MGENVFQTISMLRTMEAVPVQLSHPNSLIRSNMVGKKPASRNGRWFFFFLQLLQRLFTSNYRGKRYQCMHNWSYDKSCNKLVTKDFVNILTPNMSIHQVKFRRVKCCCSTLHDGEYSDIICPAYIKTIKQKSWNITSL